MQKPTLRYTVAAVLIAAAALGGFFVFDAHQRTVAVETNARSVTQHITQLIAAVNGVAAAQQAYVAPGQPQQPWFDRIATLFQQFGQDLSAVRPLVMAADGAAALTDVDNRFKMLVALDGRAREYLEQGESLLAADLVFSEGRDSVSAMTKALLVAESSEQEAAATAQSDLERRQGGTLAAIAVIWLAGLVLLTPTARPAPVAAPPQELTLLDRTQPVIEIGRTEPSATREPAINLAAVADVCGALARISNSDSLGGVLGQAAAALNARGIIVWLGAGEELFPALSSGYDERLVARLGPISRNAANATAAAWRSAQIRTVPADATSHGAIAVPLSGVHGCVGVFAAELSEGRESDPTTRAAAAVIAAQLVTIVPVWPAPSASQPIAATGA